MAVCDRCGYLGEVVKPQCVPGSQAARITRMKENSDEREEEGQRGLFWNFITINSMQSAQGGLCNTPAMQVSFQRSYASHIGRVSFNYSWEAVPLLLYSNRPRFREVSRQITQFTNMDIRLVSKVEELISPNSCISSSSHAVSTQCLSRRSDSFGFSGARGHEKARYASPLPCAALQNHSNMCTHYASMRME